jgi:hypothetical protein
MIDSCRELTEARDDATSGCMGWISSPDLLQIKHTGAAHRSPVVTTRSTLGVRCCHIINKTPISTEVRRDNSIVSVM